MPDSERASRYRLLRRATVLAAALVMIAACVGLVGIALDRGLPFVPGGVYALATMPPIGDGATLADRAFVAVHPALGDLLASDPDEPYDSLTRRSDDLAAHNRSYRFGKSVELFPDGVAKSVTLRFSDHSVLTLHASETDRDGGSYYVGASISR